LVATGGTVVVHLSWSAPSSNGGSAITGYKIYRGTVSGSEAPLTSVGPTTTYSDNAVVNGTTYFYKVTAINGVGEGPQSNEASAGPVVTTVPTAPVGLSASGGSSVINLSWSAPSSNGGSAITGYRIYRGATSGTETLFVSVGSTTSYSDTAVFSGTTYFYKVTAVNGVGEGPQSNEASATTNKATLPSAARNLSAREAALKGVTLNWSAPSSNGGSPVSSYRIYRGTRWGGETSYLTVACATSTCSYTDTGTNSRTYYYYEVAAINAVGTGPLSNQAYARAR
jgi:fibronectin type 3 domain-containing protein